MHPTRPSDRTAATPSVAAAVHPRFAALVLLCGVGPFATDTYLAALPAVQRDLGTGASVAQLTVTAFIVGLAVGQLGAGPVSDGRGRRSIIIAATVAFTLASVACALAPTAPVLLLARLVQGIAAGGGVAVSRAVVSDHWRGERAARAFGTLSAITLLAPVVAPSAGALVLAVAGWREVFWGLVGLGALMFAAAVRGVPETLPPHLRHAGGLRALGPRVADLLTDADFRAPVVVQCLATAGFFVYIGGSSFVLQTALGLDETGYATVFAVNAAAMATSSALFRLLVVRCGPRPLRAVGLASALTGTAVLAVVSAVVPGPPPLVAVWVLLSMTTAGMGLVLPGSTVLAQAAGVRSAGAASSLSGGSAFLVGAFATPLVGLSGRSDVGTMAGLMVGGFAAAVAAALVQRRRTRAGGAA